MARIRIHFGGAACASISGLRLDSPPLTTAGETRLPSWVGPAGNLVPAGAWARPSARQVAPSTKTATDTASHPGRRCPSRRGGRERSSLTSRAVGSGLHAAAAPKRQSAAGGGQEDE